MSRSVNTIYQEILEEKAKYASLNSLDSTSNTAIWKMVFYVTAVAISIQEQLQDVFQTNLTTIATTLPTGTMPWYAQTLLKYQDGYLVTYNKDTEKVEYPVIDESAQILKVATAEKEGVNIVLKTAKSNDTGTGLEKLTDTEYETVLEYIEQFKFAGPQVILISADADDLKLAINVQVNKTVINSLGQLVSDTSKYPVEDAINSYLTSFQNELYDSKLKLIGIVDAIQSVTGVKNAVITYAQAKQSGDVLYTDILLDSLQEYKPYSGWFKISSGYTLHDHITYL